MKKTIIHVEVGDDNWTPTTSDLSKITRTFRKAVKGTQPDDVAVVSTRSGVKVHVIEFEENPVFLTGLQHVLGSHVHGGLQVPALPTLLTNTSEGN